VYTRESGAARGIVPEGRTAPVRWACPPRRRALASLSSPSTSAASMSPRARAQRQHAEVRRQVRNVPEGPLRVTDRRLDLALREVLGPEVDGHLAPVDRRVALPIRRGRLPFRSPRGRPPSGGRLRLGVAGRTNGSSRPRGCRALWLGGYLGLYRCPGRVFPGAHRSASTGGMWCGGDVFLGCVNRA
jgi:hypothetical protein